MKIIDGKDDGETVAFVVNVVNVGYFCMYMNTTLFTRLRALTAALSISVAGEITISTYYVLLITYYVLRITYYVLRHSLENSYQKITMENVQIMNKNYSNYYKRKVSEVIYIKTNGPLLNTQDTSVPLKLFN